MLLHIAGNQSKSYLEKTYEADVQPNAIDLRIGRIWSMKGMFELTNIDKLHRKKTEIFPEQGFYHLKEGKSYEISFDNIVHMGEDEAGFVIPRSTLNRNGLFITSGLYDSGYTGALAACLHVNGGDARIQVDTRIAQFLLFKAEALHNYSGSYGFEQDGTVKEEEKQYH